MMPMTIEGDTGAGRMNERYLTGCGKKEVDAVFALIVSSSFECVYRSLPDERAVLLEG